MKIELMGLLKSMNTPNAAATSRNNWRWPAGITIAGLCLHFYFVRELAASMVLFSVFFVSLALVTLSAVFVWYAGKQVAAWTRPSSQVSAPIPEYRASREPL